MHNAAGVRCRQPSRRLQGEFDRLAHWNLALLQPFTQSLPLKKFGNQIGRMFLGRVKAINRQNVRVIERSGCPRFLLETSQSIGVRCQLFRQHFDCNFAVEGLVASAIHLAHAARAQRRDDLIGPKFCTRSEDHGRRDYNPGLCFSREFSTDAYRVGARSLRWQLH